MGRDRGKESRRRRRPNLLALTLRGLPELELFETDAQREQVLGEIGATAGRPQTWGFWFAVGVIIVAVFLAWRLAEVLLRMAGATPLVEEVVQFAVIAAAYWFGLRTMHRWGASRELRVKLLECGIPVCMKCGYALRGLPLESGACPECGRPFDERVRGLLKEVSSADGLRGVSGADGVGRAE